MHSFFFFASEHNKGNYSKKENNTQISSIKCNTCLLHLIWVFQAKLKLAKMLYLIISSVFHKITYIKGHKTGICKWSDMNEVIWIYQHIFLCEVFLTPISSTCIIRDMKIILNILFLPSQVIFTICSLNCLQNYVIKCHYKLI